MEHQLSCRECGAPTNDPRQGMCPTCYGEWYCGFAKKKACECCGFGDQRMLVKRRLDGVHWTTLCGNCAVLLGKRHTTLPQLRDELYPVGDRRKNTRRKAGHRRQRERRLPGDMREGVRGGEQRRKKERRTG